VRIGLWLFGLCYIGLGALTGVFVVQYVEYTVLFLGFLLLNIGILLSVLRRPVWEARRYFAHSADILAVSFAIYLVHDANSPFYLIYILIFISAGTRYGRKHLAVATVSALVAYNVLLLVLQEWSTAPMNALFRVLVLVALPLYQDHLLRKLRAAKLAAERANQAKGAFLANMTHELRTPLTGVLGMANLLRATDLDGEQREYADAIASSAGMLQSLIGDILDLSKIDAQKLHLEHEPFDLHRSIKEVYDILQTNALAKELEIVCDIAADVPATIHGDPLRVRQVLFNLIGNAVKFTEEGEVVIRCRRGETGDGLDRPHVRMEIADTGIGIPPDKLKTIFESFSQADDSMTRRYGGTGLGTTIARDLVKLMGGTLDVASRMGEGTCFTVRLPLDPEDLRRPPTPRPNPALQGRCVLIYERNQTLRELIAAACHEQGMRCLPVHDIAQVTQAVGDAGGADLLIAADAPARLDLHALLNSFNRLLEDTPPCLMLVYPPRRAEVGDLPCRTLNKPFQGAELVAAMVATLGGDSRPERPRIKTRAPADKGPIAIPGIRVLVAEDNEIAAKVITTLLGKEGARVTLVHDGEAALSRALTDAFDVAFVDLHMPGIDGLSLTRRIRAAEEADDGAHRLSIIALTANAAEDIRDRCLAAGMDGFLTKPVEPGALIEAAQRFGGRSD
jgi:two-component system sensor histidine kinase RpfC